MKVYIHKNNENQCYSVNNFIAYEGFKKMGWEIVFFKKIDEIIDNEPENVVVGHIDDVQAIFFRLGIDTPTYDTYPQALIKYLGRKIWTSTINTIAANPANWNVFVKPISALKKFTGVWVKSTSDLIGCGNQFEDTKVWCSEPVIFLREWRCFVRYGKILDVRPYKGDWRGSYDYKVIESAVQDYKYAPCAYAIDFGLTDKGQTLLVEVNEGYSIGAYGLFSLDYAKFLSARWSEITGTKDYCDF